MSTMESALIRNMPAVDDLCKALERTGKTKTSDQFMQSAIACRLLNPLLQGALPKEMNEKLAVFRTPEISQSIVFESVEDITNLLKQKGVTDV